MANASLFIGWGVIVRGREELALRVLEEASQTWERFTKEDRLEGWDGFFLEPHGGDLEGFFLLHGSEERLAELRRDDQFQRIVQRGRLVVDSFGVVPGINIRAEATDQGGCEKRFRQALIDLDLVGPR